MTIIDSHAHIFQYLGGRCGFASEQEHLDEIQKGMHNHLVMPVRRKKDHKIIKEETEFLGMVDLNGRKMV